jgi:hypothetical protein
MESMSDYNRTAPIRNRRRPAGGRMVRGLAWIMVTILAWWGNDCLRAQDISAAGPRAALATVNEDTIFTTGMDSLLVQIHKRMSVEQRSDFDYRKLLDKMINDRLIIQEATRLDMDRDSALLAQLAEQRGRNAIRQYVADNFKPDLAVSEDSIRTYFETNYVRVQLRSLAVREKNEVMTAMASVLEGAPMDSIAKAVSLDTYRYRGGLHNLVHLIDIEEPSKTYLAAMKPGDLSPVYPDRQAYAFFRLEQMIPADTVELPKYESAIKAFLQTKKRDAAWKIFIQGMELRYPATIDSTVLARIKADSASLFTPTFVNDSPKVVMRIDDRHALTEGRLRSAVSRNAMTSGDERFGRSLENALVAAKEELILGAAADAGGYEANPEVTAKYAASLDSALIEAYLKETVVSKIKFNRAEFETYYNEHVDDFREPGQVKLDRIAAVDSTTAFAAARRLAEGADYSYIAASYNTRTNNGAAQEWVPLESFPDEIKNDLDTLTIGRATRPYNTSDGWIILHVADRRPGKVRPLADVEMKIREVMFQRKFNEEMDQVLTVLKKGSTIVRNEAEIDRYFGPKK